MDKNKKDTAGQQPGEYSGPLRRMGDDLSKQLHITRAPRLQTIAAVLSILSGASAIALLVLLHQPGLIAGAEEKPLLLARALGWLLLVLPLLEGLTASVLAIGPMRVLIRRIRAHKPMPSSGSYELRYLAGAYNRMLAEYLRSSEELRYKAEHDALTGLYNRGAYEQLLELHQADGRIALLWVDVDYFKSFNDRYGHDVGDKVLKRVADTLTRGFRSTDYICRTGGDEFAVIMVDITPDQRSVVLRRITAVQDTLRAPKDDLPPVTLSVGAAFSDTCGPQDSLFKMADEALYLVKGSGRDGCAFYGEDSTVHGPSDRQP